MTEFEFLTKLYVEDLNTMVSWHGEHKHPRVRFPKQYERVLLIENQTKQIDIDTNVWCISDTHFGHDSIISFSDRPFMNVDEMDEHLRLNINEYVQPEDVLIWVGDVSFRGVQETNKILDATNGYKILVVGNHDFNKKKVRNMNFDEIHLLYHLDLPEAALVFTHFPMHNLVGPWINIHGHLHIKNTFNSVRHINVCCELHEYKPVNLLTIYDWARSRTLELED